MSIRIAIIGGGPSGISTFLHLKAKLEHSNFVSQIELFIFETSEYLGRGMPYDSPNNAHLVNLTKIMMEPMAEEQHSFAKWLSDMEPSLDDSLFPPRHYFGKYLAFRAEQAKLVAEKKGMRINFLTLCPVLSIQKIADNEFELVTRNKHYQVNYVILSTGHMPVANFVHLTDKPGYFANPWDSLSYKLIQPHSSVCIIGSRLTAIDVALKLQTSAHRGKIDMVSRGGLLPTVKGKPCSYSPRYLTMQNIKSLMQGPISLKLESLLALFWQELSVEMKCSKENIQNYVHKEITALNWLNREIHEVQASPRTWQTILAHFYQLLSQLWPQLSERDREHFLNHYFSLFASYNCSFPLESAFALREMISNSQLEVHSGLQNIQLENNQFIISLNKKIIKSKYVFNATGCGHDPEKHTLLNAMLKKKLIAKHALGGINAEPSSLRTIDADGRINTRIYALGDVVGGVCFYTIEITYIVQQAKRLTEHFYNHLKKSYF